MADVARWAASPLENENVFLVGEAYGPKRGWCEGALDSCRDALEQGWGISLSSMPEEKITKEELIDRLRHRDVLVHHPWSGSLQQCKVLRSVANKESKTCVIVLTSRSLNPPAS